MFLLLFVFILFVFLLHQFWFRRRHLPPGPTPLPLIGNLLSFVRTECLEDLFLEWRESYGPVFTFWQGMIPYVSIHDHENMQSIVKDGDAYADRFTLDVLNTLVRGGQYGILETNGRLFVEQRRFSLQTFKNFGVGKNLMQEQIVEELQWVMEKINEEIDSGITEIDLDKKTNIAIGSLIQNLICGYRYTTENREEEFYRFKELSEKVGEVFTNPLVQLMMVNPLIAKLPFCQRKVNNVAKHANEIFMYVGNIIEEHQRQNDYAKDEIEPRDFIDAYLIQRANLEAANAPEAAYYSQKQLQNVVFDFWLAGVESTSVFFTWGVAYLIGYPHVQQKLHEELDRVIGSNRIITMADRTSLVYTQAVLIELNRKANVGFNLARVTTRDVELGGFKLSKGTVVLPEVQTVSADPKLFANPKVFNPERFIDENGQLKRSDEVAPFSLGKRACPGQSLATMNLFLFLSNLMNQYKFSSAKSPPTLKRVGGGASFYCDPYKCRIELVLWTFYNFVYKRWRLPRGPTPWPIMGNLIELEKTERYEYRFVEWGKKYGKIFTWWLGETPIVTVVDYKLAVEMFVKDGDTYASRIGGGKLQRSLRGNEMSGIFFAEGPLWKDQRQFIFRVLRNFGLGRNEMELRIMDEVYYLVETVESSLKSTVDLNNNDCKSLTNAHTNGYTNGHVSNGVVNVDNGEDIDFHRFTDIAVGKLIENNFESETFKAQSSTACCSVIEVSDYQVYFSLGYRYTDGHEEEFRLLKSMATKVISTFSEVIMGMALFNDTLASLVQPFMTKKMREPFDQVFDFLDKNIEKHVANLHVDVDSEAQNFVEAFVIEKMRLEAAGDDRAKYYTLKQLRNVCFDLWIAGQESSSSAITWCVAYLIKNPEVQKKMHDELDAKIGSDRWIKVADRTALVYTNAVILVLRIETLRSCNLLTNGNLRRTNRDVVVEGYRIPKGTCCYCQFATIHSDPDVFPEPRAFKPERFIDSETGQLKRIEESLPFALGKRVCLGESLARLELFLFVANIFNRFGFSAGKNPPTLRRYPRPSDLATEPYLCQIRKRY
ncbi:hypothetical protein M3Y95_00918000 [Aphelenchoides besseyi]|nr:hypothetical protein M3Y95_00918000 [Aphelenchoides besseyi]